MSYTNHVIADSADLTDVYLIRKIDSRWFAQCLETEFTAHGESPSQAMEALMIDVELHAALQLRNFPRINETEH